MLPIVLQHVRELVDFHIGEGERHLYKLITPFPPGSPDFPDFVEERLAFGDPPKEGDSASLDTVRALEFFNRTDNLYYDYSYGIRSEANSLSYVCGNFFLNAHPLGEDRNFEALFEQKKDSFLIKLRRHTVGDLGNLEFIYTSLSPLVWNSDKVTLGSSEVERLRAQAVKVYEELELENRGLIDSLINQIKSTFYSEIKYDLGSFDVVREWIDPRLFHSKDWKLRSGDRVLYGRDEEYFAEKDVNLCFAQRFYVIRNITGTPSPPPNRADPAKPPKVPLPRGRERFFRQPTVMRDHAAVEALRIGDPNHTREIFAAPGANIHRKTIRNKLIDQSLKRIVSNSERVAERIEPQREGYVWIPETATVPGHWERKRAGQGDTLVVSLLPVSVYKIAAVKCRIIPRGE